MGPGSPAGRKSSFGADLASSEDDASGLGPGQGSQWKVCDTFDSGVSAEPFTKSVNRLFILIPGSGWRASHFPFLALPVIVKVSRGLRTPPEFLKYRRSQTKNRLPRVRNRPAVTLGFGRWGSIRVAEAASAAGKTDLGSEDVVADFAGNASFGVSANLAEYGHLLR